MVADRQLRVATKYIQDDIPALLEDVELWVQSGAGSVDAEQKAAIRETLNNLEARLNRVGNHSGMSSKHVLILTGTNGKFFPY
jgi:flagellin-like hook-associated protein FlgL